MTPPTPHPDPAPARLVGRERGDPRREAAEAHLHECRECRSEMLAADACATYAPAEGAAPKLAAMVDAVLETNEVEPAPTASHARARRVGWPRALPLAAAVPLALALAGSAVAAVWIAARVVLREPEVRIEPPSAPSAQPTDPARHGVAARAGSRTVVESQPAPTPALTPAAIPELPALPAAAPTSNGIEGSAAPRDPSRPSATASATALFEEATAARRAGRYAEAARGFLLLQRRFPTSTETMESRVILGRLYLEETGDFRRALDQCQSYLGAGAGNLAEEARVCRAEALNRLGRTEAERRAWEELLDRHPNSLQVARARSRLQALAH